MAAQDEVHELAVKLAELLDQEGQTGVHVFTPTEVKDLQRVLAFVRRFDALGWWGKWLFYLVVTAGAILANWERIWGVLTGGKS